MDYKQYRRAKEIREKITRISQISKFYESDEKRILEIATSDDLTDGEPELYQKVSLPKEYQIELKHILVNYKLKLEKEFKEL